MWERHDMRERHAYSAYVMRGGCIIRSASDDPYSLSLSSLVLSLPVCICMAMKLQNQNPPFLWSGRHPSLICRSGFCSKKKLLLSSRLLPYYLCESSISFLISKSITVAVRMQIKWESYLLLFCSSGVWFFGCKTTTCSCTVCNNLTHLSPTATDLCLVLCLPAAGDGILSFLIHTLCLCSASVSVIWFDPLSSHVLDRKSHPETSNIISWKWLLLQLLLPAISICCSHRMCSHVLHMTSWHKAQHSVWRGALFHSVRCNFNPLISHLALSRVTTRQHGRSGCYLMPLPFWSDDTLLPPVCLHIRLHHLFSIFLGTRM